MEQELDMKVELLQDDLDGTRSDDVRNVVFAIDGATYEIDLTEENTQRFFDAVGPFAEAARPVGGRKAAPKKRKPKAEAAEGGQEQETPDGLPEYDTKKARAWLKANGHEISDRGRVKPELAKLYTESDQYQEDVAAG